MTRRKNTTTWTLFALAALVSTAAHAVFLDERAPSTSEPASAAAPAKADKSRAAASAPAGVVRAASQPKPAASLWMIQPSDGTLANALRRWSAIAHFQLLWEAPKDLPATFAAYKGTFHEAVKQVMGDSLNGPYPLHACSYDNAVRVLHITQACRASGGAASVAGEQPAQSATH